MGFLEDQKRAEEEQDPFFELADLATVGSGTISGALAGSKAGLPGLIIGGLAGTGAGIAGVGLEKKQQQEARLADQALRARLDSEASLSNRMAEVGAANASQRRAAAIEAEQTASRAGLVGGGASQFAQETRQDIAEAQQAAMPAIFNQAMQDALSRKQAILQEELVAQDLLERRSESDAIEQIALMAQQAPALVSNLSEAGAFDKRDVSQEILDAQAAEAAIRKPTFEEDAAAVEELLGITPQGVILPDAQAPVADVDIAEGEEVVRQAEELAATVGAGGTAANPPVITPQTVPTPALSEISEPAIPTSELFVDDQTAGALSYGASVAVENGDPAEAMRTFTSLFPYDDVGGATWDEYIKSIAKLDPGLAGQVNAFTVTGQASDRLRGF